MSTQEGPGWSPTDDRKPDLDPQSSIFFTDESIRQCMGVRPPSSGSDDEPDAIEFGIAAVDARLERSNLLFPASKTDVDAELGTERVPYDVHGNTVSIGDVLERVDRTEFDSKGQLLNDLHPHFETYRRKSGGIVDRVRRLLPL